VAASTSLSPQQCAERARKAAEARWEHDSSGINARIDELVDRMPAATDEQRARLAMLLTIPPAQRDHSVAS
jgi:hypothetical protein